MQDPYLPSIKGSNKMQIKIALQLEYQIQALPVIYDTLVVKYHF